MRILINALPAKMGGNANYLKEVASLLPNFASDDEFVFLVPPELVDAIRSRFARAEVLGNAVSHASFWKRLWFDQVTLRALIRKRKIDSLFSTADFAMFTCPCRQVLLVRNPTHFFEMYLRKYAKARPWKARLIERLRAWLVFRSVKAADIVLTPSQATLDELRRCVEVPDRKGFANLYGVNPAKYSRKPADPEKKGPWNLLFVSLYTDHKNLITLLRAMEILVKERADVELATTADPNWPPARITQSWAEDSRLAASPGLRDRVHFALKDVASAPKNLYGDADIFVYPSVVETFGHALAEAMASGLPIVAADVPINRELCGDAALYFRPFDAAEFAQKILSIIEDAPLRQRLSNMAFERSRLFSWERHTRTLLACLHGEKELQAERAQLSQRLTA